MSLAETGMNITLAQLALEKLGGQTSESASKGTLFEASLNNNASGIAKVSSGIMDALAVVSGLAGGLGMIFGAGASVFPSLSSMDKFSGSAESMVKIVGNGLYGVTLGAQGALQLSNSIVEGIYSTDMTESKTVGQAVGELSNGANTTSTADQSLGQLYSKLMGYMGSAQNM